MFNCGAVQNRPYKALTIKAFLKMVVDLPHLLRNPGSDGSVVADQKMGSAKSIPRIVKGWPTGRLGPSPHYSRLMVRGAAAAILEKPTTSLPLSRLLTAAAGPHFLHWEGSSGRCTSCMRDSGHTSPLGSLSATFLQMN